MLFTLRPKSAKSVDLETDDSISFQKVPMTVHWVSCLSETLFSPQCPRPPDRLDHTFHQDSLGDLAAVRCADILWFWIRSNCDQLRTNWHYNMIRYEKCAIAIKAKCIDIYIWLFCFTIATPINHGQRTQTKHFENSKKNTCIQRTVYSWWRCTGLLVLFHGVLTLT